jgi:Tfp pilus assembly protein PilF
MGVLIAAFASALVVYGARYLVPAWQFAKSEPRYIEIVKGRPAAMVELDALTQSLRATHNRADLSRAAFVQMLTAQQLGLKSFRALTRLTSARRDLRLGLGAAPSDAYAWTRLAVAESELGNSRAAGAALSMALELAPSERGLSALHFDLGVVLWGQLDRRARQSLAQRLKWAAQVPELAQVMAGNSAMALKNKLNSGL